jgi:hypothetical protein
VVSHTAAVLHGNIVDFTSNITYVLQEKASESMLKATYVYLGRECCKVRRHCSASGLGAAPSHTSRDSECRCKWIDFRRARSADSARIINQSGLWFDPKELRLSLTIGQTNAGSMVKKI